MRRTKPIILILTLSLCVFGSVETSLKLPNPPTSDDSPVYIIMCGIVSVAWIINIITSKLFVVKELALNVEAKKLDLERVKVNAEVGVPENLEEIRDEVKGMSVSIEKLCLELKHLAEDFTGFKSESNKTNENHYRLIEKANDKITDLAMAKL